MSVFSQIVILLIVLACMVMILLAIRRLAHFEEFDNNEGTQHLKDELKEDEHILSDNNIFSSLVEIDKEKKLRK